MSFFGGPTPKNNNNNNNNFPFFNNICNSPFWIYITVSFFKNILPVCVLKIFSILKKKIVLATIKQPAKNIQMHTNAYFKLALITFKTVMIMLTKRLMVIGSSHNPTHGISFPLQNR